MSPTQLEYERRRDRDLRRKYGITYAQYLKLLGHRDGGCWTCGKVPLPSQRPLHVDHDHKRGHVRGLLCWPCNKALVGRMTPDLLRELADYLEDDGHTVTIILGE